jgi:transposase
VEAKFADVPDALWERVESLLPKTPPRPKGGRPRVSDRVVLAAIVYRLRTGCQWKALPAEFSSGSTCHLRFQQWVKAGVFSSVFAQMVRFYDGRRGIQWEWTSLDSATVKAPKGGTSPVPTRRTARKAG